MFESAILKIERAKKHINDLHDLCSIYVDSNFCELWVEKDEESGSYFLRLAQTKKPPMDIPLIIGDAVHNLRSSLDIAYCELIRDIAGIPLTPKTQIKIANTRKELVSSLTKGKGILVSRPDIAEVIATTLRPYKEGNEGSLLHALHDLNITDKHIILIPIFCPSKAEITNIKMGSVTIGKLVAEIGPNGVLNIAQMGWDVTDFSFDSQSVSFSVLFGKDQPLSGKPVISELRNLVKYTESALKNIQDAVLKLEI
ncbi:TPA: hypothetical protein KD846_000418 [Vibrio alginolyticus]|nr:hypothetical protein [Vibrio alginolyticus]